MKNPATVSLAKCTSSFEVQLEYELRYFTKAIQGDLRGCLFGDFGLVYGQRAGPHAQRLTLGWVSYCFSFIFSEKLTKASVESIPQLNQTFHLGVSGLYLLANNSCQGSLFVSLFLIL